MQLQQALDASRRRAALLEGQITAIGGMPAAGGAPGTQEAVREVLAQSAMHFQKYKGIREDYNRLLNK